MFAIFIISSDVQSDLTATLTVPDHISSIETVEDLINFNLVVYGKMNYKELIWNDEIRNHFRAINKFTVCLNYFFKKEYVACIHSGTFTKLYIYENKTIHISKNSLAQRFRTYTFTEDLPLLKKFNLIISRLVQGGFLKLLMDREERYCARNLDEEDDVKGLDVDDLIIIFSVLIAGWVISLLIF